MLGRIAGSKKRCLRRLLVPCLLHTAAALVIFTISVVTFDERHLGILPSFIVAAVGLIPQTPLVLQLFGPPCVSKSSYPFRMLPLVETWTCTQYSCCGFIVELYSFWRPVFFDPRPGIYAAHGLGCGDVSVYSTQTAWRCLDTCLQIHHREA